MAKAKSPCSDTGNCSGIFLDEDQQRNSVDFLIVNMCQMFELLKIIM